MAQGKLNDNKLRYFKPLYVDNKVISGEFLPLKSSGSAPCKRFGHTMGFLPLSNAILISGGRNDDLCHKNITPFLNDIHMFLLD
jgi:hypothetical protein